MYAFCNYDRKLGKKTKCERNAIVTDKHHKTLQHLCNYKDNKDMCVHCPYKEEHNCSCIIGHQDICEICGRNNFTMSTWAQGRYYVREEKIET